MTKKEITIWTSITLTILVLSHVYLLLNNPFELESSPSLNGTISAQVISDSNIKKVLGIDLKEKIVLGAEWILVVAIFLKLLVQSKVEFKEYDLVITKEKTKPGISNTDLDTLYGLLKEKKKIQVRALAIYFKVDENTIISWAKILEEANLLTIHYPNFGHPILILNEEVMINGTKQK